MNAKSRIAIIRLAEKIKKNKVYADQVGVSVEMRNKVIENNVNQRREMWLHKEKNYE